MAAFSMFSPRELHGKTGKEKQEMMFDKFGVNFNDYPVSFKRGTYAKRVEFEREAEVLLPKHNLTPNAEGKYMVTRTEVRIVAMDRATQIPNYEEILFMKLAS